jgi:esterase/lipase superfamily enzyme
MIRRRERPQASRGNALISQLWNARLFSTLTFALATLVLASCGGRPQGVLLPVTATAAGTSHVNLLVATTRAALPLRQSEMFSGERAPTISFADITVSIPPDAARDIGEVQWPASLPGNPAREFVTTKTENIDLQTIKARFAQRIGGPQARGKAIVFVHGYNSRFEDAVFRFAQIIHDSKAPGLPILFTWPSRGEFLAYAYDRESANYSRDALEQVLQTLAADPRVSEIGVLAHSMGNWVTMEALRTMALRSGRIHPKIANVMLAAPDLDVDVFQTQLRALGDKRPAMTLFVSQDDRALQASRRFWGDVPRVGSINPEEQPFKDRAAAAKITVVDLTKLKSGDPLAHGKFAQSPDVVRFIGQRLVAGQSVNDSRETFSQSLAQSTVDVGTFVGGAAGAVIRAPISLVDGTYRTEAQDDKPQDDKPDQRKQR